MKVCIAGESSAGKSTLARQIADKYKLKVFSSDYIKFDQKGGVRGRRRRSPEEYGAIIESIANANNWVYEGSTIDYRLLERCDKIIWLKTGVMVRVYRQWKRFFSDKIQRQEHGVFRNIILSIMIIFSKKKRNEILENIKKHADKITDIRELI